VKTFLNGVSHMQSSGDLDGVIHAEELEDEMADVKERLQLAEAKRTVVRGPQPRQPPCPSCRQKN
jgi:hypothetical protein